MSKKYSVFLFIITLTSLSMKGVSQVKTAFSYEYPQFFTFRGETNKKVHQDYNSWYEDIEPSSGMIRKLIDEEVKTNPNVPDWVGRMKKKHPEKLFLLHLNGEARQINAFPDVYERYFPGHWVYESGGILKEDCDRRQALLHVENIDNFNDKRYVFRNKTPIVRIPTYVLLVKLDKQGNRLWYESEIAHVKKINRQEGTLLVERGMSNSKARSFKANETYVAPIAGDVWGGDVMFYYNLSSACPKDKNGKTAAEIFIDEIADWFSPSGVLKYMDGIAFDVNYFSVSNHAQWDVNNDGNPDGGIVDGQHVWREGDWKFLTTLRKRMGDNFIITADGHHPHNQQAVGILNGIESEGLVQHNDAWRGFSRTVNTHTYWRKFNNLTNYFNYVVLKFRDDNDLNNVERLMRFSIATAAALEAYTTYPVSSLPPYTNSLPSWIKPQVFGKSVGTLIRAAKYDTGLLPDNLELIAKKHLKTIDCNIEYTSEGIVLSPISQNQHSISFEFNEMHLPSGDLTFFINAKSLEPLDGFNAKDRVPRIMRAGINNLPDYGEGKRINEYYDSLNGMVSTIDFFENSFYYRKLNNSKTQQTIRFNVDGGGKIIIKSFQVFNQPDILIKEFEHAIVCINPSLEKQFIDLTKFPISNINTKKQMTIDSVDAVFIKK